ncbi:MAG: nitroreductase family deazaflavin-dependent oxidoreductase [Actinomycetota bacterium]|nr:nitroreductase family deazaflavin-dependent oxidoreductase [Actinomycetota bacterium]
MSGRKLKRAVQELGRLSINKVLIGLIRSGVSLPFVARSVIGVVTVGRRSGRRRTTPVGYVRAGENRLLVVSEHGSRSDWVRNARAAGKVEVWFEGRLRTGRVRLLPDEDPSQVLRRISSRVVAAANRVLWHEPKVVEIALEDDVKQP